MALIAMAIYDTPENNRAQYTRRTLESLAETLDATKHRVFLVINAATEETEDAVLWYQGATQCEVLRMPDNVGTARAINQAWKHRKPGEHCVKMDNDVFIYTDGWADLMELAISLDDKIGVIGLRRPDLCQSPTHKDEFYRCYPQKLHKQFVGSVDIERTADVMGTCVMHSSDLLDKVGYLYQPGLYGFDDVLMCIRSIQAGFYNCFIPCDTVKIEHIDPGEVEYQHWKAAQAQQASPIYRTLKQEYESGVKGLYYPAEY